MYFSVSFSIPLSVSLGRSCKKHHLLTRICFLFKRRAYTIILNRFRKNVFVRLLNDNILISFHKNKFLSCKPHVKFEKSVFFEEVDDHKDRIFLDA